MAQYRALVGIDYPPNKRVEAGEVVSDLPGSSIKWLLESNIIESTDAKSKIKQDEPLKERLSKIDLSDGLTTEEEEVILATAKEIEEEKK